MIPPSSELDFLEALVRIREAERQRDFVKASPVPITPELVEALATRIRPLLNTDSPLASTLTETLWEMALGEGSKHSRAFAHRCRGHVLMSARCNRDAAIEYQTASTIFSDAGNDLEYARTLVAESENLNFLGRYRDAEQLAARARDILMMHGDDAHLARVHVALGNLLNRLNRISESLQEYDRARRVAEQAGDHHVVAAVEINRADALTESNRLDEAIAALRFARGYCARNKITLWDETIDRNLADLHFKRGAYSEALRDLEKVRARYLARGDTQRLALSDMTRAEICLELNLTEQAAELAENAGATFEKLSSPSEVAHCLAISGTARAQLGDPSADDRLRRAALGFREIGDEVSGAGTDLQRARLMQRSGEHGRARVLALAAAEQFDSAGLGVRAAYARMVAAQSLRAGGEPENALGEAELALESLEGYHAQWVAYQCRDLAASLLVDFGQMDRAEALYRDAIADLESLRGNIRLDEFRMSFGRDKYQVYEHMVDLKLTRSDHESAFEFAERSKSRTLIDLLEKNTDSVWLEGGRSGEQERAILEVRRRLTGLYSQLSQAGTTVSATRADRGIQDAIRSAEAELVGLMRRHDSTRTEWAELETGSYPDLAQIRSVLTTDEVLIEYYVVNGQYCAFAVTRDELRAVTGLATTAEVRGHVKGMGLQISKFDFGVEYTEAHASQVLTGVQHHLRTLYQRLVEPLAGMIAGRSLVIVPHMALHYVPFHALWNGESYLVDDHDVVYAPSASVLRICRTRPETAAEGNLVLAVPDESAPSILEEARVLGALLPGAEVLTGAAATSEALAVRGPRCRRIHIAAHGVFRSDNPMFSSLRLGDGWLDLMGVFSLRLGADLTTLSGCETGMSALDAGDELMGLARGFLYAGTPSLVVSLWRVHDESTAGLMERFYGALLEGDPKPRALRKAMLYVKQRYPHPYYWAPFVLLGRS